MYNVVETRECVHIVTLVTADRHGNTAYTPIADHVMNGCAFIIIYIVSKSFMLTMNVHIYH